MFQVNDVVLYNQTEVCTVVDIRKEVLGGQARRMDYYVLEPLYDGQESLIFVPVSKCGDRVSGMITAEELKELLDSPGEGIPWPDNMLIRRREFSDILREGDPREMIGLIRTLRRHQLEKAQDGQKLGESDEKCLVAAANSLYPLLRHVLQTRQEDVVPLVAGE